MSWDGGTYRLVHSAIKKAMKQGKELSLTEKSQIGKLNTVAWPMKMANVHLSSLLIKVILPCHGKILLAWHCGGVLRQTLVDPFSSNCLWEHFLPVTSLFCSFLLFLLWAVSWDFAPATTSCLWPVKLHSQPSVCWGLFYTFPTACNSI